MSERAEKSMHGLKQALEASWGRSPTDEEVIGILKGDVPLDRPTAAVLMEFGRDSLVVIGTTLGIADLDICEVYTTAFYLEDTTPEELAAHPEVVRRKFGHVWPPDKPFPLTPLEAWYVMRGWEVAPAAGITMRQIIDELPGKLEGGNDWIRLWEP